MRLSVAISMGCAILIGASYASAEPHRTVTVEGDFKDQKITAPVRKAKEGEQVLVPGGAWTDCAGDCKQALKNSTFDFWNTQEGTQSGQLSQ